MPGVLPSSQVGAARELSPRQSGSRGTDTSSHRRATRPISASVDSGCGVLEHLDRGGQVELVVREGQRAGLPGDELEVRAPPALSHSARAGSSRSIPTARVSQPLRQRQGQDALAAADVEQGARLARSQRSSRSGEACHQAADDRIRGAVLVVGVAGGDVYRGSGAHSLIASVSASESPNEAPRPCRSPGRRALQWSPPGRSLWRRARVRRLHAQLELHPAHPLQDALLEHAAAGEDVTDDPQRGQLHRDDEHRGAEDQRLDVPPLPGEEEPEKRTQITAPTTANSAAAARKTRSGS